MKFSSISDVHIKEPGDERELLFLDFLASEQVKDSSVIFLLGDIFDLMIGNHEEYLSKFNTVFRELERLVDGGKKVFYVEGNHDFHLRTLFLSHPKLSEISYEKDIVEEIILGKRFLFCHGDNIEVNNPVYKTYKRLINNFLMENVADRFPYSLIRMIGDRASRKSRHRNKTRYDNPKAQIGIKDKFRASAVQYYEAREFDYLICGHSHYLDRYEAPQFTYLNNGYFPKEKTFIHFDGKDFSFVQL